MHGAVTVSCSCNRLLIVYDKCKEFLRSKEKGNRKKVVSIVCKQLLRFVL